MILLVDRSNGEQICDLSGRDFEILQNNLVLESEQDYDYYLTSQTLEVLSQAGISKEAVLALSERMKDRGLDIGWEYSKDEGASFFYQGLVVEEREFALGGIRVDLLDGAKLVSWTYTTVEGKFSLAVFEELSEPFILLSGRGDLTLLSLPISASNVEQVFQVQTLNGVVSTEDDEPVSGLNISLIHWKVVSGDESRSWVPLGGSTTWGDSDSEGNFTIPVSFPTDVGPLEVELEITTIDGQTLEKLVRTISPVEGFDLGVLRVPYPEEGQLPVMPMEPLLLQDAEDQEALATE